MRTTIIFLLTFTVLVGCKKLAKKTQFYIEENTETTIPATMGINAPFNLPTPTVTTNYEQTLEENDTRKDLIEYANLVTLVVDVLSPESANFNFLNDIDIYINADNLEKQKIAEKHDIPENDLKSIALEIIPDIDLTDYIKADQYQIETTVTTDKTIFQDVDLNIYTKVFIDAKVLGL
ncbi:MAG: hypothetical protein ACWA41_00450 [Putridiphycobacter sp.]